MSSSDDDESVSELLLSLFKVGDFVKIHAIFDAYIQEIYTVEEEINFKVKYVLDNKVEDNIKLDHLKVVNYYDCSSHTTRLGTTRQHTSEQNNNIDYNTQTEESQQTNNTTNDPDGNNENTNLGSDSDSEADDGDDSDTPELMEFKKVLKQSFHFKSFEEIKGGNKLYEYLKRGKEIHDKGWIREVIQKKEYM